eukprot:31108_1
MFHNAKDDTQFKSIFNSLENSQIIHELHVPFCINKVISEYATGMIIDCVFSSKEKCSNTMIGLHENFENNTGDYKMMKHVVGIGVQNIQSNIITDFWRYTAVLWTIQRMGT